MNPNNTPASSSSQPSAYPPRFSLAVFPDQVGFQIVQDDGHGKVQKVENLAIIPPAKLRELQMYLRSRQTAPYPERPFEVLYEGQTKYDPLCVLKPSSTRPAPPSLPLEPQLRLLPLHESDYCGKHTIGHPYVDRYLSRPRLTRPRAKIPAERQDALLFALGAAKVLYEPSHPKYSFFWPRDDEVKKETIQLMYDVWSFDDFPIYLPRAHLPQSILLDVSNFVRLHHEHRFSSKYARHPHSRLGYNFHHSSSSSSHHSHKCTHAPPSIAVYKHLKKGDHDSSHWLPYPRQECNVFDGMVVAESEYWEEKKKQAEAVAARDAKKVKKKREEVKVKEEKERKAMWERTIVSLKASKEARGEVVTEEQVRRELEGMRDAEMECVGTEGEETEDDMVGEKVEVEVVEAEVVEVEEVAAPEVPAASSKRKRAPAQPKVSKAAANPPAPTQAKGKGKGKKTIQPAPPQNAATATTSQPIPAANPSLSPTRVTAPLPKRKNASRGKRAAASNVVAVADPVVAPAPENSPPPAKRRKTGAASATNDPSATDPAARKATRGTHSRSKSNESNRIALTSDTAVNVNGEGDASASAAATPSGPLTTLPTPRPEAGALPQFESRDEKESVLLEIQAQGGSEVVENASKTKGKGKKRKAEATTSATHVSKRTRRAEPEPLPAPEPAPGAGAAVDAEAMDVDVDGEVQAPPVPETETSKVADEQNTKPKRTRKPSSKAVQAAAVERAATGGTGPARGRGVKSRGVRRT
ncbi:uncharacterized protein STEHIDRAFT_142378 [Stereum hirsutum FP-91666 SS1]|uniref:uncharacterized protein n=1 Tax=Stereum hirsutum (strain FP-91666) TaxID=721885 RepID=UPI000444968E|nr:uncharacterized protein STEHIDRAFT_142378 [Stereum hirsutum FP-91666 SS1]EIM81106.1 hypothetical protein STEHIDRAFT_142378 [Stereum hirsutum FP-91666 SS1]